MKVSVYVATGRPGFKHSKPVTVTDGREEVVLTVPGPVNRLERHDAIHLGIGLICTAMGWDCPPEDFDLVEMRSKYKELKDGSSFKGTDRPSKTG